MAGDLEKVPVVVMKKILVVGEVGEKVLVVVVVKKKPKKKVEEEDLTQHLNCLPRPSSFLPHLLPQEPLLTKVWM